MDFYTLDYIVSHQSLDSTRRLAAIIVLLVVALAFSALYLRNRVKTRWRDAGIGLLVFSLVLLGIQTEQYLRLSDQQSQAQLLVGFMEGVAVDHGVQASDVMVNKTSLQDGMIVRFNEEDYTAVSMGGSNEFVECFCWGAVVEGGSGAVVELVGDGVEVWLVAGDGGSFG